MTPMFEVEVSTTDYNVWIVEAESITQARMKAMAGDGHLKGSTYSDGETHEVRELKEHQP